MKKPKKRKPYTLAEWHRARRSERGDRPQEQGIWAGNSSQAGVAAKRKPGSPVNRIGNLCRMITKEARPTS